MIRQQSLISVLNGVKTANAFTAPAGDYRRRPLRVPAHVTGLIFRRSIHGKFYLFQVTNSPAMGLTQHEQSGQGVYAVSGPFRVPHVACHVAVVGEAAGEPPSIQSSPPGSTMKLNLNDPGRVRISLSTVSISHQQPTPCFPLSIHMSDMPS